MQSTDLLPSYPIKRLTDDFIAEQRQFACDVDVKWPAREAPLIDTFRFRRYLVLGWIRCIERHPYYELTPNGEAAAAAGYVARGTEW
jgi:hypothetical protein